MKFTLSVGTDLTFELYVYTSHDPLKYRNERHWVLKQCNGDPHSEPMILRLIDAQPTAIADHILAEAFGYNAFAESLDFHWTLYTGLLHTALSAQGQEHAVPINAPATTTFDANTTTLTARVSAQRFRLEDRIRAIVTLMNSTDDYFTQREIL